jgi:mannose-1-phosphate guanylyltransferase
MEMQRGLNSRRRWAVVLAGGEGVRLRSLTRLVSGDNRPKQFCPLLGGRTLLAQTRIRITRDFAHSRTLFVLLKSHECFYRKELGGVAPARMIVQPSNRGTLPAILASLMRIIRQNRNALVAFFPSDHFYFDEKRFRKDVESAFTAAEDHPQTVILLAAEAKHPEVGYGWIEVQPTFTDPGRRILSLKHFWEKPSQALAEELLDRGCLWNTFVMVGTAQAFADMIRSSASDLYGAFEPLLAYRKPEAEEAKLGAIYENLRAADFSKQVLSANKERLAVLPLGDVGWSDLGDPRRVITVLSETGVEREWVTHWHREVLPEKHLAV